MSKVKNQLAAKAVWTAIGSIGESLNGNRLMLESETHVVASLLHEFREHLTVEERKEMAIHVLQMVDMEAVENNRGKYDPVGGEPHADTFEFLVRGLLGLD